VGEINCTILVGVGGDNEPNQMDFYFI
jgi:hypothetical protein